MQLRRKCNPSDPIRTKYKNGIYQLYSAIVPGERKTRKVKCKHQGSFDVNEVSLRNVSGTNTKKGYIQCHAGPEGHWSMC